MVYSTGFTVSEGGFMLPQKAGLSTLFLSIAAPGILMFGPQGVAEGLSRGKIVVDAMPVQARDRGVEEWGIRLKTRRRNSRRARAAVPPLVTRGSRVP